MLSSCILCTYIKPLLIFYYEGHALAKWFGDCFTCQIQSDCCTAIDLVLVTSCIKQFSLLQANVYRAEKNLIELYVLLLRYSKCVYLVISKSLQMLCYIWLPNSLQPCVWDYTKAQWVPHIQVREKGLLQKGIQFNCSAFEKCTREGVILHLTVKIYWYLLTLDIIERKQNVGIKGKVVNMEI
jgi:hypothetical protein